MALPLQGSTPNLQGGLITPVAASVGVKATSPTTAVKAPVNTIPKAATAPKDLSSTYALVNGTVYNKNASSKFSNEADFFKDSGVNSFSNLKFDTAYTPTGKETIYGQQVTPATPTPPIAPPPAPVQAPVTTPQPVQAQQQTPQPPATPYTPPNQGTTGVSQGGIIGNLLGIAQNESPEVAKARGDLKALEENYAKQTANIEGTPMDLSLAGGQQGILNRLFAAKQGAAQTALSSALTSQGQGIQATQGAGGLNAPITNPQTGGLVNPSSNTTVGSTTSGSSNISTLIGEGDGTNGHAKGEFFNTQTGKGFSTPQELANFVNGQMPGAGANAQNVFTLLKSGTLNGNSGGGALNPLNQLNSIAQQVINGQISPSQAYAMGGTIPNWQSVFNAEVNKQSPGFDTSAAQARYDSNQTTQTGQGNLLAQFKSAQQQGQNLTAQFSDLITKYNLNPNELNVGNSVMQFIASHTSDARYQALQNYANDIANTYASILGAGGTTTDMVRQISSSFINQVASGTSIKQALASLDQQAQAKIAGVQTPSTTGAPVNTGGGTTSTGGGTWNW